MKHTSLFLIAALASAGCAHRSALSELEALQSPQGPTWADRIASWPEASQNAAREMGQKYGSPDEATDTHLVWLERGPWKRSILSREPVPHEWPEPHLDVLEQVIDFRVDPARIDDLARFDGSVMVERTKGELSARCGSERANFLAINLARDVATAKRTVEDARAFYEEAMAGPTTGEKAQYMAQLMFDEVTTETADPDSAASEAAKEQTETAQQKRRATEQSGKGASKD